MRDAGGTQGSNAAALLGADDVRDYLLENPDFFDTNEEVLGYLIPPTHRRGDRVEDFQRFMVSRLQGHVVAMRGEQDDLIDLMQDQIQRQNRVNAAALALVDTTDFESLLTDTLAGLPEILEHAAVSLFMETRKDAGEIEAGEYGALRVVPLGFMDRFMRDGSLLLIETPELLAKTSMDALRILFGEAGDLVQSLALVRLDSSFGLPPLTLALGHENPVFYATDLATEPVEFLGDMMVRTLARLCKA